MTVIWSGGSGGTAALILQLRSRLGELSASHLATWLPSEEVPVIHWIGSWECPRADLDVLEKSLVPLPGIEPRSFGCTNNIRDLECLVCVSQKYNDLQYYTEIFVNNFEFKELLLRNYIVSYYFTFIGHKISFTTTWIKTICNFDTCRWITWAAQEKVTYLLKNVHLYNLNIK
jgi:hypothetical protein